MYIHMYARVHVIEGKFRHKQTGRLVKMTDGERLSLMHVYPAVSTSMLYLDQLANLHSVALW